ncbi:hypothetical protein KI387_042154, partial [Taxus chinensis]
LKEGDAHGRGGKWDCMWGRGPAQDGSRWPVRAVERGWGATRGLRVQGWRMAGKPGGWGAAGIEG